MSERTRETRHTSFGGQQTHSSFGRKRKCTSDDTTYAKRSKEDTRGPASKIVERIVNGKRGDTYCWICHEVADDVVCPDCPRVYHNKCFKKIKFNLTTSRCVCKWSSVDGPESLPNISGSLKELLPLIIQEVSNEKNTRKQKEEAKDYRKLLDWPLEMPGNEVLCNILDVAFIIDNIRSSGYKNTNQFFLDVKWISHNSAIVKGGDHILTTIAKNFEKAVKLQLSDMEACGECYKEKCAQYPCNDFFAKVCSIPHPVVWAKLKGFPFWPAKCLRIVSGQADVRFFGTHDKSLVPLSQVYKISRENPGGNPKKPHNSSRKTPYEEAMDELSVYVENFENEYGTGKFQFWEKKTPLQSMKLRKKRHQKKNQSQLDDSMEKDAGATSKTKASGLRSSKAAKDSSVVCNMTFDEEHPCEVSALERLFEETSYVPLAPEIAEVSCQVPAVSTVVGSIQTSNVYSYTGPSTPDRPSTSAYPSTFVPPLTSAQPSTSAPGIISTQSLFNLVPALKRIFDHSTAHEIHLDENDEEIQLITEIDRRSTVNTVFDYPNIVKTLSEILYSNKPNLKDYIHSFQNVAMKFYLSLWLQANASRIDITEFKTFSNYCEKLYKAIEAVKSQKDQLKSDAETLKCQNSQLKSEVEDLKQKLATKKEDNKKKYALREEIINKQVKQSDEQIITFRSQMKEHFASVEAAKNNAKCFQETANEYKTQLEQSKTEKESLKQNLVKAKEEKILKLDYEKQLKKDIKEKENLIKDLEKQKVDNAKELEEITKNFMEKIESLEEKNLSMAEKKRKLETELANKTIQPDLLINEMGNLAEEINILNQSDENSGTSEHVSDSVPDFLEPIDYQNPVISMEEVFPPELQIYPETESPSYELHSTE